MITTEVIKKSISGFLQDELNKKLIEADKKIETELKSKGAESPKMQKLVAAKEALFSKYEYNSYMKLIALTMCKQVSLATHISKGVHSMSKGDNILFKDDGNRLSYIAGSHNVETRSLDISGNAASLPIYKFINIKVTDEVILSDLLKEGGQAIIEALSDDRAVGTQYLDALQDFLKSETTSAVTSELNKQLLFPVNGDDMSIDNVDDIQYENVIPLYASMFCREAREKINDIRYSKADKAAKDNRFAPKKGVDHEEYRTIRDLASMQLGGSKPQNVSKLLSAVGGENVLLPSIPPKFKEQSSLQIPKGITSIFDSRQFKTAVKAEVNDFVTNSLRYERQPVIKFKAKKNNALWVLVSAVFDVAIQLQENKPGWLKDHSLDISEKFWLDPNRGLLDGQGTYAKKRAQSVYQDHVLNRLSHFINESVKLKANNDSAASDSDSFDEIKLTAINVLKSYNRNGLKVFL
ncbi:type I-F CRISPR-associated protein Csy1 [Psychrobacter celer]|uniref:type I-F CRISPR-associated protein Csy1 n=1 Tax=Psychrobacter celer TaxID=306572 RepID=UPI003FD38BBC